jgi:hypothetical protein
MARLVEGRRLTCHYRDTDRYGRIVRAVLLHDGRASPGDDGDGDGAGILPFQATIRPWCHSSLETTHHACGGGGKSSDSHPARISS